MYQYDREIQQLEDDLQNGIISDQEFRQYVRELNEEFRDDEPEWSC